MKTDLERMEEKTERTRSERRRKYRLARELGLSAAEAGVVMGWEDERIRRVAGEKAGKEEG